MTICELIEQARRCNDEFSECYECPFNKAEVDCREALINTLADKLEQYENYLREQSCHTCKYFKLPQSEDEKQICSGCFMDSKWIFRGDVE